MIYWYQGHSRAVGKDIDVKMAKRRLPEMTMLWLAVLLVISPVLAALPRAESVEAA